MNLTLSLIMEMATLKIMIYYCIFLFAKTTVLLLSKKKINLFAKLIVVLSHNLISQFLLPALRTMTF